jgi:hypothetical protein
MWRDLWELVAVIRTTAVFARCWAGNRKSASKKGYLWIEEQVRAIGTFRVPAAEATTAPR